jgi:general secretion pathway protein G
MIQAGWRRRSLGFTLIEMVVTVAIVGLLASVAFPLLELADKRSREHDLRDALRTIRTAIDDYKHNVEDGHILDDAKGSGYPPTLEILVSGVVDAKSLNGSRSMFFLRRIPRDPFAPAEVQPAALTWGLRSYASTADAPAPGADVFDVYSLAPGVGLNGIPYREW